MPAFHLTATEVAFGAPIATILAGAISYLAARKGSKDALKAQQQLIDHQIAAQRELLKEQQRAQEATRAPPRSSTRYWSRAHEPC